jgi:hypothetical protein
VAVYTICLLVLLLCQTNTGMTGREKFVLLNIFNTPAQLFYGAQFFIQADIYSNTQEVPCYDATRCCVLTLR